MQYKKTQKLVILQSNMADSTSYALHSKWWTKTANDACYTAFGNFTKCSRTAFEFHQMQFNCFWVSTNAV
jgi:hypothetical protein